MKKKKDIKDEIFDGNESIDESTVNNTENEEIDSDKSADKETIKDDKKKSKKSIFTKSKKDKADEPEAKSELELANEKIAEINDKYLRLYSEFDNYRKRTIKEKSDIYKTAGEDVIVSIISIIDDFERALANIEDNDDNKAHREGLELIANKFIKILEQKNVKEIKAIGEKFDTDIHEAITNIPAPSDDMKGKVIDAVEKGYTMNDKVIRFAKVVVGA